MSDTLESLLRAGLLFGVIFALSAVILAVARRMRGAANQDASEASEIMTSFRSVYERGGLSDEEFRTIKSKLATDLKSEAKDTRSAG